MSSNAPTRGPDAGAAAGATPTRTPIAPAADLRTTGFDAHLAAVRAFTDEVLIPAEAEVERTDAIPEAIVQQMREIGLFAITLPEAVGGMGWTMEEQVRLTFEFTRASAVYRSRFSTTIGLCSQMLLDFGTEAQRQRYLPAMASGAVTAAFCLTEDAAGSDAGNVQTTARRGADGGHVLDGRKRYITNAPDADLFVIMARTTTQGDANARMSVFLAERGVAGLTTSPPVAMMGQRGSHVGDVVLRDCALGPEALLGGAEGNGLKMALRGINHARTHVAATAVGQAVRLLDEALRHATARRQFGQRLADFQAIQLMLGESRAELAAARALVLDVARRFDDTPRPHVDIAAAKLFATEMAGRVADRAVQILGGEGYMNDQPVARIYRDVRLLRIFEGTSQIHQINIAKSMIRTGRVI